MKNIFLLNELKNEDKEIVGKKATNLGELTHLGINVPEGFVISTNTFNNFLETTQLKEKIIPLLKQENFSEKAAIIKRLILSSKLPQAFINEIKTALKDLPTKKISVSLSVGLEADLHLNNWEVFTYSNNFLKEIKEYWALIFGVRELQYFSAQKINPLTIPIGIIVQEVLDNEISGSLLTSKTDGNNNVLKVRAVWGYFKPEVNLNFDEYVISKNPISIITKKISHQEIQFISTGTTIKKIAISKAYQEEQKLADDQILGLARQAATIEDHFLTPMYLEWVKNQEKIYITKLANLKEIKQSENTFTNQSKLPVLLNGTGVFPGISSGIIRMIHTKKDLIKVKKGECLVARNLNLNFSPAASKASALVTDLEISAKNYHLLRRFSKPTVVGTRQATKILKPHLLITVDGTNGVVYQGLPNKKGLQIPTSEQRENVSNNLQTATKVYLYLGSRPYFHLAKENCDGAVFDPEIISEEDTVFLLNSLCENFNPRPIIYTLRAAKERFEDNLKIIKKIRHVYNHSNLSINFSFVKTPQELARLKHLISTFGIHRSSSCKFFLSTDFLANILLIDNFLNLQIDGIILNFENLAASIFETNKLNLINPTVITEAILNATEDCLKKIRKEKIFILVNLNKRFVNNTLIERLIFLGVNSIITDLDSINKCREIIYSSETNLVNKTPLPNPL